MADVLGIPPGDDAHEMAMVLWRSTSSELVHAKPIVLADENRLNGFVDVMHGLYTEFEFPFRPAQIECNDRALAEGLSNLLRDSGTTAIFVAEMTEWNAVLQDMTEHFGLAGPPIPSLMDVGCTEQQIREFADAAAAFYRAKLWDFLDDIDLIKIETPKPQSRSPVCSTCRWPSAPSSGFASRCPSWILPIHRDRDGNWV